MSSRCVDLPASPSPHLHVCPWSSPHLHASPYISHDLPAPAFYGLLLLCSDLRLSDRERVNLQRGRSSLASSALSSQASQHSSRSYTSHARRLTQRSTSPARRSAHMHSYSYSCPHSPLRPCTLLTPVACALWCAGMGCRLRPSSAGDPTFATPLKGYAPRHITHCPRFPLHLATTPCHYTLPLHLFSLCGYVWRVHRAVCVLQVRANGIRRHAVYYCGPRALCNATWEATSDLSDGDVEFAFHHETFEF